MGIWGPITKGVRSKALQKGRPHPTENFWIFSIKMVHFGGFWGVEFEVLILQISSILFHAEVKKQCRSVIYQKPLIANIKLNTVRAHHLQMKGLHMIERPWNLTSCRHARQSILPSHWIKFPLFLSCFLPHRFHLSFLIFPYSIPPSLPFPNVSFLLLPLLRGSGA